MFVKMTFFSRPLTEEEKEEQKAKLEREAAAAKQKRDAAKAEQAAVKAEQIAKLAAAKARHQDGGQAKQSPLSSFTQVSDNYLDQCGQRDFSDLITP